MPDASRTKVRFFFDGAQVFLKNRASLKRFIEFIFMNEGTELESVNYIFCRDRRLRDLNRKYLDHDYNTDIITFELSGRVEPKVADVFISVDRVRKNAASLNQPTSKELHRVIFHGALHLCGYRDKTAREGAKMRKREDYYLERYLT